MGHCLVSLMQGEAEAPVQTQARSAAGDAKILPPKLKSLLGHIHPGTHRRHEHEAVGMTNGAAVPCRVGRSRLKGPTQSVTLDSHPLPPGGQAMAQEEARPCAGLTRAASGAAAPPWA